jgi:hypothetical protein
MIDRVARDRAALLLRRFAVGRITNDDFERDFPESRVDPALRAVNERAWLLYNDLFTHRLSGDRALTSEGRREVARWVLFLYSDVEYMWPASYSFIQVRADLMNLLTLGWWERRKDSAFSAFAEAGEFEVWPFRLSPDYQAALRLPRLGHN